MQESMSAIRFWQEVFLRSIEQTKYTLTTAATAADNASRDLDSRIKVSGCVRGLQLPEEK